MQVNIAYQEKYSRLQLLLRSFFGLFYIALPHGLLFFFYLIYASLAYFIGLFITFFTGKLPKFSYNAQIGVARWGVRLSASLFNLVDGYPPFGPNAKWQQADVQIGYPEKITKLRILFVVFLSSLFLLPHAYVLLFLQIAAWVISVLAWFAVLIFGTYPKEFHGFMVGIIRWQVRVGFYASGLYFIYPDFTLDHNPEDAKHQ